MTTNALSFLMIGVVAVQLGILLLIFNRLITGHWWTRPGSKHAIRVDLDHLRADTLQLLRQRHKQSGDPRGAGAASNASERDLLIRLASVRQNLERGDHEAAGEAAQWFQWEVFKARVQGTLSRQACAQLIDDAQMLCKELERSDGSAETRKPSAAE